MRVALLLAPDLGYTSYLDRDGGTERGRGGVVKEGEKEGGRRETDREKERELV